MEIEQFPEPHYLRNNAEIRRVVKETVHETLSGLGLNVESPHDLQADLIYLRRVREGSEEMAAKARGAGITLLVSTFLVLMWEAFKMKVRG
jgi:hypothetical protein